ncbi:SRPBCC domain-containing protein [Deinococcus koreensis]|uniref:ATPase n=1 Tax=Deinococcus koreensis TaxID=2054903 RepID=A0A2K3URS3_9DEIO|nr:SRPBCC domain-containing protein [Deinococcus koreensis]PNY79200.1 ATPase [Deinococcus koreensis]
MQPTDAAEPEQSRQIETTRLIRGPRSLVFRAWTEARHLDRWFGPRGFTTTTHALEFRVGGVWAFDMRGPDGTVYPNHIEWREIVPVQRIAFRHGAHAHDQAAFDVTVRFVDRGEQTELTLRTVFRSTAERDAAVDRHGAAEGAQQTLERLERFVDEFQAPST